jgi:hypothetical protein
MIAHSGATHNLSPDIVWMSVNSPPESTLNQEAIRRFATRCVSEDVTLAIGGRCAFEIDLDQIPTIEVHRSMQEFSAFLERFKAARTSRRRCELGLTPVIAS